MSMASKLRAAFNYLRPYQNEAVEFLLSHSGAILADAMGLGKTCSALTAARYLDMKTVIICPSYVRGVWRNPVNGGEIKKWWENAVVRLYQPESLSPRTIPDYARIILIHYDIVHAWSHVIAKWGPNVVILDECHFLTNDKTQRSKGVREICKSATYRWGLSGTPLTNRPRDLWNVVDTLTPGYFGTFFAYAMKHCDAHKISVTPTKVVWDFKGSSNIELLKERLSRIMLRRTVQDVALQLPPKTRQTVFVDVKARGASISELSPAGLRRVLDLTADAKLEQAYDIIRGHVQDGHKVVAFTYRREIAEWLVNSIRGDGLDGQLVHGGVSHVRRGLALENAKGVAEGGLLAATIDSSSTGIDLSYADVAVFVELTYEPHELLQAEARLHRFGQTRPVLIQYIIAKGTSDEIVAGIVVDKLDTFEAVVGNTNEGLSKDLRETEANLINEIYSAIAKMGQDD